MANTLEIVIKATDKASKEIGSVAKGISGLGDLGGAVLKGVGIAGAAAVTAATAVGAALGKLAVDALPLQGITGAFEGITGDADAMLAALQKGSQGMITNKDLMMSYNLAAQLVGKQFADQLPDAMQYLTKVASATGQDMGFMMDSLVKGVGRMSPMILDNLGIQVSLADATARAAEMFGVEAEELTKAQQQAGMMDVVLEKLKTNTASMPEVAGAAAQGWAALGIQFKNIKDRIGLALVPALNSLIQPLSMELGRILPQLVDLFETRFAPAIERAGAVIGSLFAYILAGIEGGDWLNDWLAELPEPLQAVIRHIMDLSDALKPMIDSIKTFVSEHSEAFKAALVAIGAVLAAAAIASAIMGIGAAIAALANPITLIIAAVGLLAAAWTENWGGIQEKTQAAIDWIAPKVKAFVDNLTRWWGEHGDEVTATVMQMWTEIQQWFTTAIANVTRWVQTALANIKAWWSQHGEAVMSVVKWLWDAISNAFATAFGVLKGIVSMALAIIRGDWHEAGAALRGIVDTMWAGIRNAFELGKQAIVAIVQAAASAIRGAFSLDWGAVGRGIIDGIAGGVRAAAGWLGQAAADAARAALDAAKGFLGIQSPSKVTAELIGKPFAQGIYKGIEDASRVLERTKMPDIMATMTAAPMAMQRTGAQATSTVNNSPQYHLHINTSAPTENIIADFAVLQALAG